MRIQNCEKTLTKLHPQDLVPKLTAKLLESVHILCIMDDQVLLQDLWVETFKSSVYAPARGEKGVI